jgi:LDH2 family malate/lactate/ureidoglycolate dehydrogenase
MTQYEGEEERNGRPDGRTYGQWWDWEGDYLTVPIEEVRTVGRALYEAAGASPVDAAYLFDALFDKTMQGDHARGLVYLPGLIRAALSKGTGLRSTARILREHGATAVVGSNEASGPDDLVCRYAMSVALDKARQHGIGVVGARAGARLLTPLVAMAVDAGMVGIVFTQSGPTVAPTGGYRALLGNGPTAVGIPAGTHDPVILDLSFTQTSSSPVLLAARQGQQVPPGLILDKDGAPTTDPRHYFEGDLADSTGHVAAQGSLAALGNGHKGYAVLFVIGLLAQLLSDTSPPWELGADVTDPGCFGSVHMAIDPTCFSPDPTAVADHFIEHVATEPRRPGMSSILYPGARSQQLRRARQAAGTVDVPRPQVEAMLALAEELGVAVPEGLTTPKGTS